MVSASLTIIAAIFFFSLSFFSLSSFSSIIFSSSHLLFFLLSILTTHFLSLSIFLPLLFIPYKKFVPNSWHIMSNPSLTESSIFFACHHYYFNFILHFLQGSAIFSFSDKVLIKKFFISFLILSPS